ncbi:hypothetical protein DUNSADRAFT_6774 [Dunaliella salina]|uniref:Uncharacterized protein n=1 Tax=Dunaliella salina TaxID=3046 RepID=A0ABQ7H6N7_DUNSA|nr:hypothetical protein DUNSADRAFT_6774 [Dunaliella salina]|eukprot:KAF5842530.1 hypothetical protein DUNSADRAFT_6774 [Dunaliella salina]
MAINKKESPIKGWHSRNEGLGENSVQLDSIQGPGVLMRSLKLVQVGVIVAVHFLDILLPLPGLLLLVPVDGLHPHAVEGLGLSPT